MKNGKTLVELATEIQRQFESKKDFVIPEKKINVYTNKMRSSSADLLATNVKYWLERSSDRRMIRTLDGNVRALLSDKYRPLDNYDLAQSVLPMIQEAGCKIESAEITDRKLYIKAVSQKVQGEVKVGDVVNAGIIVSNSEVGLPVYPVN